MAIKNYTTEVPANRSINEIQEGLIKHGAAGVMFEYEPGTAGKVESLKFILLVNNKKMGFALPCQWRRFQEVLKQQEIKRWADDEYAYRVAWRCIRDWVLAQLALYETQIVELPQVFLPFAVGKNGKTLYDATKSGEFLLGDGK